MYVEYTVLGRSFGMYQKEYEEALTDACQFPKDSLVWEINYRGDLVFKDQANAQKEAKNLYIEDGWIYFIHGWTQVVSEVFHVSIEGEVLDQMSELARG